MTLWKCLGPPRDLWTTLSLRSVNPYWSSGFPQISFIFFLQGCRRHKKFDILFKFLEDLVLLDSLGTTFQEALVVKNPPATSGDVRDVGSILGLGRFPGGGNGNPLQYSCPENPTDRGDWRATVHGVSKSWTRLKQLSTPACKPKIGWWRKTASPEAVDGEG